MAVFSNTLDELVEKVCRMLNDWVEGTSTDTGTTTTLVDSSRPEADDYFNLQGSYIYIRSGTYAGSYRKITDFASSSGTITFAPALAGAPGMGVSYSIHTKHARPTVVEAINLAIEAVAKEALVFLIDETTIELASSTYEYDLPTNLFYLFRVTMANDDGTFDERGLVPPTHYTIVHTVPPKLRFLTGLIGELRECPDDFHYGTYWADSNLTAGRKLRLEGLGSPATLTADSDTCSINPNYIVFQAAAFLSAGGARRTDTDPDAHFDRSSMFQSLANQARRNLKVRLPPHTKKVIE